MQWEELAFIALLIMVLPYLGFPRVFFAALCSDSTSSYLLASFYQEYNTEQWTFENKKILETSQIKATHYVEIVNPYCVRAYVPGCL